MKTKNNNATDFFDKLRYRLEEKKIFQSPFVGMTSRCPTGAKYERFGAENLERLFELVDKYISIAPSGATFYWRSFPAVHRPRMRIVISGSEVEPDFVKGKIWV